MSRVSSTSPLVQGYLIWIFSKFCSASSPSSQLIGTGIANDGERCCWQAAKHSTNHIVTKADSSIAIPRLGTTLPPPLQTTQSIVVVAVTSGFSHLPQSAMASRIVSLRSLLRAQRLQRLHRPQFRTFTVGPRQNSDVLQVVDHPLPSLQNKLD